MKLTPEQEKQLQAIDRQLKILFRQCYGSIKFNLNAKRPTNEANINVSLNLLLKS